MQQDFAFANFGSELRVRLGETDEGFVSHIVQTLASMIPYSALRVLEASQDRRDDHAEKWSDILTQRDGCCSESDKTLCTPFS